MRAEWQTNTRKCLSQHVTKPMEEQHTLLLYWNSMKKTPHTWKVRSCCQGTDLCWCCAPESSEQHRLRSLEPVPVSQKAQGDHSTPPKLQARGSYQESHTNTSSPQSHGKEHPAQPPKPSGKGRAPQLKQRDVGHILIFLALLQTLHRPTNKA